jgi:hypothetical protein
MKDSTSVIGPVIIGGVGGSGTRVVAEIVALYGFFMGKDLNNASDNLSYTLLFKRPAWFRKYYPMNKRFITGLSIMEKALLTGEELTYKERVFLKRAAKQMSKHGHTHDGRGRGDWVLGRLPVIKYGLPLKAEQYAGWGWKEPNTHLALEAFEKYFPNFKYIHTVRHGLDMAFSDNQQQLYNWGPLFGIKVPEKQEEIPLASFRFWVEANRRAIETGKKLGPDKFLLLNFDKLCDAPHKEVIKIADFLGITLSDEILAAAARRPSKPGSTGRYREHPGIVYSPDDLAFLKELGFEY